MDHHHVTVSVIIPTYNHRDFVLEALSSVFGQTYSRYEIIVVNDGSEDDTAAILAPSIASGKIRYFEQPNSGQAAARNRGISEAGGEFIALLDDDDLWPSDKLQWQVDEMISHPEMVLVYGYAESFGLTSGCRHPDRKGPSGWVQSELLRANWLRSPGQALIRTSAIRRIRGFDHTLWGSDDWDCWIRLAAVGPFHYHPRLALNYRQHARNSTKEVMRLYENSLKVLRKNLGSCPSVRTWRTWIACWRFIRCFSRNNARFAMLEAITNHDPGEAMRMWYCAQRLGALGVGSKPLIRFMLDHARLWISNQLAQLKP